MTANAWLYGVEILGLENREAFRNQMSALSAALKRRVKRNGRREDVLVDIYTLVQESGVSEDFIRNAIASRLLDKAFRLKGAYFPPDDRMQNDVSFRSIMDTSRSYARRHSLGLSGTCALIGTCKNLLPDSVNSHSVSRLPRSQRMSWQVPEQVNE